MSRTLSLLLVSILLFAGVTSGLTAAPPPSSEATSSHGPTGAVGLSQAPPDRLQTTIVQQENGTNVLRIGDNELVATRIEETQLSVGTAAALDHSTLQAQLASERFEAALEDTDTNSQRRVVLEEATADLDARVSELEQDARLARDRFNSGGSPQAYLRSVARIYRTAAALREYAAHIRQRADVVPETTVAPSLSDSQTRLDPFQGPVRAHISRTVSGTSAANSRVYIATSEDAVVLATIANGQYLRDGYRAGARGSGDPVVTSISQASQRIETHYPWAWENQQSVTASSTPAAGSYRFSITSAQGTLTTYLDTRSGDVYREIQRQPLSTQYLRQYTTTSDGLSLSVNRTYASGPAQVTVRDAQSGEPVSATVLVNSNAINRTGSDGVLWLVTPHSIESVTVVSVRNGEAVSTSVTF